MFIVTSSCSIISSSRVLVCVCVPSFRIEIMDHDSHKHIMCVMILLRVLVLLPTSADVAPIKRLNKE